MPDFRNLPQRLQKEYLHWQEGDSVEQGRTISSVSGRLHRGGQLDTRPGNAVKHRGARRPWFWHLYAVPLAEQAGHTVRIIDLQAPTQHHRCKGNFFAEAAPSIQAVLLARTGLSGGAVQAPPLLPGLCRRLPPRCIWAVEKDS